MLTIPVWSYGLLQRDNIKKYKKDMKHRVRLTESDLNRIVMESVKRIMNEGKYGYPDDVDEIILCFESDVECMKMYEAVIYSMIKKKNRGIKLDFNLLVNSSWMKKFQQFAFRKFKQWQDNLTKESPYHFREYVANKMLRQIENGDYE